MRLTPALACALLSAAASPASAWPSALPPQERTPRLDRPLGVDTPGPVDQLLLDMPLRDARPEGPSLDVRWGLANSWSYPTQLTRDGRTVTAQLDEQADKLTLALVLPWRLLGGPEGHATTLEWRLTRHWGGWTDRPIEAWHVLGAYSDFGRPAYPRDAVSLRLEEPGGGKAFALTRPAVAAGDLVLRTALLLAEGERLGSSWALALRLDLKAPIGRPETLGGSGGADAGAGLAASLPVLDWLTAHGQLSLRRVSQLPGGLPLRLRDWQYGAEASLVAHRGELALLLESRLLSPLFQAGWRVVGDPGQGDALTALTRAHNEVSVGLRWGRLTAWLQEDWTIGSRPEVAWIWFYDTNAPDLAIGVSYLVPL